MKKQLSKIRKRYRRVIVITNQTYGARKFRFKKLYLVLLKIRFFLFLSNSNLIDAIYICTHHPFATNKSYKELCSCRKPRPKHFKEAKSDFNLNLENSLMVGDRITDLYPSSETGIRNNYLIVNKEMFNLSQNPNFNFFKQMPFFKFVKNIEEVLSIDDKMENAFSSELQILYLSAGIGTRLNPVTTTIPKPLIKIQGDKLLSRLISQAHDHEPTASHIVNISHLAHQFATFSSELKSSSNVSFVYEPVPIGSAKTLINLAKQSNFTKNILVIHGDLFLHPEYFKKIFSSIEESQNSIVFGHYRTGIKARSSIKIGQKNTVISVENKNQVDNDQHVVNSGVYFFRGIDLKILNEQNIDGEVADTLLSILAKENKLNCFINTLPRISIDSLASLAKAQISNFPQKN
jgi:histidinol phosphatase-like enzyme/CTP:phosphocholine cytidylyltransferase-like protein